jgi:hypothetical protein
VVSDTAVTSAARSHAVARARRSGFFLFMSALLLLIVIVGFAPTLFLRGVFADVPPTRSCCVATPTRTSG